MGKACVILSNNSSSSDTSNSNSDSDSSRSSNLTLSMFFEENLRSEFSVDTQVLEQQSCKLFVGDVECNQSYKRIEHRNL